MGRAGRALFVAGVLLAAGWLLLWAFRPRPIAVELATVSEGSFPTTVEEDGKTRVRERYVVSAPVAGRLLRIAVKAGDVMTAGGTVATILPTRPSLIDPRTRRELVERVGAAEAMAQEAIARQERAQVLVRQSQADVQRVRTLRDRGVSTAQQLEREELTLNTNERDLRAAELRRHAAEHELEQARVMLRQYDEPDGDERLTVRAPVGGRVLRLAQESETVVSPGTALIEIGEPTDLEVVVDVLTTDAVAIKPGASVRLERWGGPAALEGRVRSIEPGAFTKMSALGVEEQRVWVVIDITSPPTEWQGLGDGFRLDARITVDVIEQATIVPGGALFRRGDAWAVFAVEDGRARERRVEVVRRSGLFAAVGKDLRAGDRVILFPSSALSDGARVKPL